MLVCLTMIDDLPEVQSNLEKLCASKKWKLKFLNAPSFDKLMDFKDEIQAIYMNPNKSHIGFNREVLTALKKLEVLCTASTGTVHIDLEEAEKLGIKIISIKKYKEVLETIPSTAELAFALTMDGVRKVTKSHNEAIKDLSWDFEKYIGKQIKDLKVGVIGYGRLGRIYSEMMLNAGAQVSLLDPRLSLDFEIDLEEFKEKINYFDVIALHIHAEGNKGFINQSFFQRMRGDVVLVNTSRGEIVDYSALFPFLVDNPNATYCTDVIPMESYDKERNDFIKKISNIPNIIITQHIGGMSTGARKLAFGLASELLLNHYGVKE
jgi:D-3-phosphoglycerate dehydrogenase